MTVPLLRTKRLTLETTTLAHAGFLLQIMNTPEYLRFVGDRNLRTIADAKRYIEERMLPQLEKHGHTNFIIRENLNNSCIGLCGLYIRDWLQLPDIGFALLPDFQGKGYAKEACDELLRFGFKDLHLEGLLAITLPENTASRNLLEKLNFSEEGLEKLPDDDAMVMKYMLRKSNTPF